MRRIEPEDFSDPTEIIIKVKINKAFGAQLIAFLKDVEYQGKIGHSGIIGFMADGDGSCNPKISISADEETMKLASTVKPKYADENIIDYFYDVGY